MSMTARAVAALSSPPRLDAVALPFQALGVDPYFSSIPSAQFFIPYLYRKVVRALSNLSCVCPLI